MVASNATNEYDIDKLIIPDSLPSEEPSFRAYIEAEVYDKEGHIIQHHRQSMKSLTQYFLPLMSIPLLGTYQNASTDSATGILTNVLGLPEEITGNVDQSVWTATIAWEWFIQLGSGTQAFSLDLNSLAAPIANGTGAGQLSYGTVNVTYAGSSIIVSVTVTNNTSNTITVTEIGLTCTVGIFYASSGLNTYNYLLSYDTFSSPISIPAGLSAEFQITISFSG